MLEATFSGRAVWEDCCQEMLRRRWPEPRHDSKLGKEGGVPADRGGRLPPTNSFREASATVGLNVTSSLILTREEQSESTFLWSVKSFISPYLIGFDSRSCSGAADQALPVHRSSIGPITGSDSALWFCLLAGLFSHVHLQRPSTSNEAWTLCINCRMWWHKKIY